MSRYRSVGTVGAYVIGGVASLFIYEKFIKPRAFAQPSTMMLSTTTNPVSDPWI